MVRRATVDDEVMISIDPHKASKTAAVLDPVTKTVPLRSSGRADPDLTYPGAATSMAS
jgi:hypothetical protein